MAWARCVAKPGIFDNEFMVGLDTIGGRKHLFVWAGCVRETEGGGHELSVSVMTEELFQGYDNARIVLPSQPFEGGTIVTVAKSSLANE